MNQRKSGIAVLIVLLSIVVGACKKGTAVDPTPLPQEVATAPSPEQYHQGTGGTSPATPVKFFKGSIGSRLGLEMKLMREGDHVTGSYLYRKVGTRIDLKGIIDKDNNISLDEFDSTGKQTGVFKGSWTTNKEDGLAAIAGNWSHPDGSKPTAFSLHEEPVEFTGGVELNAKVLKETNKKQGYEIEAQYPQVTGGMDNRFEKFNQEVKSWVTRQVSDFKKSMVEAAKDAAAEPADPTASPEPKPTGPASSLDISYTIALAKDDFVSVKFEIGSFSSGAAHPNSSSAVINYDVKAGKTLKLADLFNPGAKYLQTISAYCIKDLKQRSKTKDSMLDDTSIANGAAADAKNFQSWAITKKGLEITFDPYQVAAYAAGPQIVTVPYSDLKELIKPDGPLGQYGNQLAK
jgi:Protein of unknown function (DUF3298)/Deacetylase PdaC